MSGNLPYKKGTILMSSGGTDHLHVVCNDPVMDVRKGKDAVLIVNVTSIKEKLPEYDKSCILNVGDHPFIKHPSYVYYKGAVVYGVDSLAAAVDSGEYTAKQDMLDETFRRVLHGFEITDETPYKITKFYEKHCKSK